METKTSLQNVKPSLKPRLHERFVACDGDAIFHRQRAVVATRGDKFLQSP